MATAFSTPRSRPSLFFFNDTATTEIYTLSLHDALPISSSRTSTGSGGASGGRPSSARSRSPTSPIAATPAWTSSRRSEEHTSELQSRQYLVCRLLLVKKNKTPTYRGTHAHSLLIGDRYC